MDSFFPFHSREIRYAQMARIACIDQESEIFPEMASSKAAKW
jgi:hypothetical protein